MTERSDEETLDLIKSWWQENGTTLMVTVAVAVAGIFGWRGWQASQTADAALASVTYAEFQSVADSLGLPGSEQGATARHLAEQLQGDFADTGYAAYAAFALAQAAVTADNLDVARDQLQWVLDAKQPNTLKDLARVRLARVLVAEGDNAGALALLAKVNAAGYLADARELTGDIRMAQGEVDQALSAYVEAMAAAEAVSEGPVNRPFLRMKLDDLGANS